MLATGYEYWQALSTVHAASGDGLGLAVRWAFRVAGCGPVVVGVCACMACMQLFRTFVVKALLVVGDAVAGGMCCGWCLRCAMCGWCLRGACHV